MRLYINLLAAGAALLETGLASRLNPPVIPLIVRNPYLSTWLGDARITPWNKWPMFWNGEEIGFGVLAAVPGTGFVYPLLGRPHDSLLLQEDNGYNVSYCTYEGATYDASTTNLTYSIPAPTELADSSPPLEITLSFLSPITPACTLRQSIPASYLTVHVRGNFDVDIYVDVNGQWVSGDRGSRITWKLKKHQLTNGKSLKTWKVKREEQLLLSEIADRAEWGTLYFSAPSDAHHEAAESGLLRPRFARTGTLQNATDDKFRSIMDKEPVFAFSKSFHLRSSRSSVKPRADSIRFTIAHIQDPVAQFAAAKGLTLMKPLWKSFFKSVKQVLEFHYLDFEKVSRLAYNYSTRLTNDAQKLGGDEYRDIVDLTARQVIGATSFSGTPENPILFLKEISSSGNFQTIDMIFPAFPFFLYTNPRWLVYLLEPLIQHMSSGQYPRNYAMHDLGAHFPNATGHPDGNDEYMPVEESGNILIMGLALIHSLNHSNKADAGSIWEIMGSDTFDNDPASNSFSLKNLEERDGIAHLDGSWGGAKDVEQARKWFRHSYKLWCQWTEYLIENTLEPSHQLSTDDFAGPLQLQTNLALKGILGIKAMSEIAATVNHKDDFQHYLNISETYIDKWVKFGLSRDQNHMKLSYDWYGSWTNLYNLYADSLLCFHLEGTPLALSGRSTHLPSDGPAQKPLKPAAPRIGFVPHKIYSLQSKQYHNVRQRYGLPLDSRHLYGKTDWEFFATAVASRSTRAEILHSVAQWVNETVTDRPFTDVHNMEGDGNFDGAYFLARPSVGGHFAWLALEKACGGRAVEGLSFLEAGEEVESKDEDEIMANHDVGSGEL